ncbi:dipicolinate synthase subunit B [Tuberibacillus sp. Marseille-P3662]|uniref:dipicolinate synthase subunit B n=1 Tax=Tuberibacillus sp. Marseille-P3662 TaxID=1965358 RepID=UPI000A1C9F92|nr:dipicolinate synthase subunit B [Tuberibacillus sp. Marseille-P3662]
MDLKGKHIGFGLTGSHCTYDQVVPQVQSLLDAGATVTMFVTYTVKNTVTRFGDGRDWVQKVEEMTGNSVVDSIVKAEPYGPKTPLDCMVIAPMTGNSISKFANAMTDSPVLMAAKATIRNQNPVVLGISTNDALGMNATNLATLLNAKYVYFIPFGQDVPDKKENSLVARMDALRDTVESALDRKQYQPMIIERFKD